MALCEGKQSLIPLAQLTFALAHVLIPLIRDWMLRLPWRFTGDVIPTLPEVSPREFKH
jgi:hypothetical protein